MKLNDKLHEIVKNQPNYPLAIIGLVIGILIAYEYGYKIPRIINPAVSNIALDETEQKLVDEQAQHKEQLEAIDNETNALNDQTKIRQTGLTSLVNQVEALKANSAMTDVVGEGIEIILDDSAKNQDANANAIAHASDLRDLVDQLRANGATAISIGAAGGVEERVTFTTSIDCIVNTVLINNTKASPPFKVTAIGDRIKLKSAIDDRGALKDIYDRVDNDGLKFVAVDSLSLKIKRYSGNYLIKNAKVQ